MTRLRILGAAALALVMLASDAMARGGEWRHARSGSRRNGWWGAQERRQAPRLV